MRTADLYRLETGDEGTFGKFVVNPSGRVTGDDGYTCVSAELPWRNNANGKSCILPGTYLCARVFSPHFDRPVYLLHDVPARTAVEIHSANFVGDRDKGLKSDLRGCIAVGERIGTLEKQKALLNSSRQAAEVKLNECLGGAAFMLTVHDIQGKK